MMLESSSLNDQPRLKKLCLQRDDSKCMVTGVRDVSKYCLGGLLASTRLAHILPLSIGKWHDKSSEDRISQIWATLYRLFPRLKIGPSEINDATNLMTLMDPLEDALGKFNMAFEPTVVSNQYRILLFPGFQSFFTPALPQPNQNGERIIRFRSHIDCPLPGADILHAHACIAKILHSSDIFKRVQRVLQVGDTTRHLATDGTTELDFLFSQL
ncbi:hypothetical protein ASPZODRAFT_131974 [Penicilliopsis zonata CBS 506.65]|uniref:HNH nuclease domain-containing protein n=1 Tax=Penicilliopsis zonata CBS 506.65 TaxID=1073090 RepID=A0A1L9SII1_9EURO|nr:hypothetical protein ASPZODRAFT_131974 [Penicilliopsis zonata CBS 506.65]OJJ47040.1 hypothetical protein ASPZODRAFT_131974 [Penicilliopsis zonata CBS 506.65]